jgi:hypothetical protein
MNVRELLQTEIWSKESSRKILRRTWRIVRPLVVLSGVLVLLLAVVFAVEWFWLTSEERKAGRTALAEIEGMEQLERNRTGNFDAMNSKAKALVRVADQKAWTLRDRRTSNLLEIYRWGLETEHEDRLRESQIRQIEKEKHLELPADHEYRELEEESRASQAQVLNSWRSLLHKELD